MVVTHNILNKQAGSDFALVLTSVDLDLFLRLLTQPCLTKLYQCDSGPFVPAACQLHINLEGLTKAFCLWDCQTGYVTPAKFCLCLRCRPTVYCFRTVGSRGWLCPSCVLCSCLFQQTRGHVTPSMHLMSLTWVGVNPTSNGELTYYLFPLSRLSKSDLSDVFAISLIRFIWNEEFYCVWSPYLCATHSFL